MSGSKKIAVVFFRAENGSEPVRSWLLGPSKADRMRIGEDIRTVEFGWPIGMPVCRPLGGGLYEVRTSLKDRIARVIFSIGGGEVLLLHGFIKKTRTTSKDDLDLAVARLKTYRRSQ